MKQLGRLSLANGPLEMPPTSEPSIRPFTIPIKLLSLHNVDTPSAINPSSLPLLRSIHLRSQGQPCRSMRLLLPQLLHLRISNGVFIGDSCNLIQTSTSITSLSLHEMDMVHLDDASKTVIKERVLEWRVEVVAYGSRSDNMLMSVINGSKVMKKVILDACFLNTEQQALSIVQRTLRITKAACQEKKIEFWRENFDVGNGKVSLEK
jgi:hypothetical protein